MTREFHVFFFFTVPVSPSLGAARFYIYSPMFRSRHDALVSRSGARAFSQTRGREPELDATIFGVLSVVFDTTRRSILR